MTVPFLSSEDYDERAHQCYDAGDYDEALRILREGLGRYPDSADLQVGLGYVRMAREEFAWARQSFVAALQLEPGHEDAWVGLGEALLKFGDVAAALACFGRVDGLEIEDGLDLGLAMGRALYREGLFHESRSRLAALAARNPDAAEVHAALGYTLHALGDEAGALRELRRSLRLDAAFHEARIYLSHILYERGDRAGALRELEAVPPAEHWDSLSLWRVIDLKTSQQALDEDSPCLAPWRARLAELETEPDTIDHLLAEVETAFAEAVDECAPAPIRPTAYEAAELDSGPLGRIEHGTDSSTERGAASTGTRHRVRTREGDLLVGSWEQIVAGIRDRTSDAEEPISVFMFRAAMRIRRLTGTDLPHDDAEAFVRASARLGLLRIED